jgi:hypothetical protein
VGFGVSHGRPVTCEQAGDVKIPQGDQLILCLVSRDAYASRFRNVFRVW